MEGFINEKDKANNDNLGRLSIEHVCLKAIKNGVDSLGPRQKKIYDEAMNAVEEEKKAYSPPVSPEEHKVTKVKPELTDRHKKEVDYESMTDEEKYLHDKKTFGWKVAEERRKERMEDQRRLN